MQTFHNSKRKSQVDQLSKHFRPKHHYRIRSRVRRAKPEILWMTNDLNYAREIADRLNRWVDKPAVWVEQWENSTSGSSWKRDRQASEPPRVEETSNQRLRSGDVVLALLLEERTRKGGWKAVHAGVSGPVTNSDSVPLGIDPGTIVSLRIGAIDSKQERVQFQWVEFQDTAQSIDA